MYFILGKTYCELSNLKERKKIGRKERTKGKEIND